MYKKIKLLALFLALALFVFLLIDYSIENNIPDTITGSYQSTSAKSLRYIKDILQHRSKTILYSAGTSLQLYPDSTFYQLTCGNILRGTWSVIDDSLILHSLSNRYRNDSLHHALKPPRSGRDFFIIKNTVLYSYTYQQFNNKPTVFITLLEKKAIQP